MLDINLVRQNPEKIKEDIASKNVSPSLVDEFLAIDQKWRELTAQTEEKKALLNKLSKERKIEEARSVKAEIKILDEELKKIDEDRLKKLRLIPNPPLDNVPRGKTEAENVVLREVGKK